jgi:rare lipoprotein A
MRGSFAPVLLLGAGVILSGCAEAQLGIYTAKQFGHSNTQASAKTGGAGNGTYKIGSPYQIDGVWYYPQADPNYDETGIASWYGAPFHGLSTANGELYDQNALSAAHKTLPMPSYVRVTNLENGRSIIVRVNDRGPFVNGRVIDMSRRGAQLLGYDQVGTARVRVQAVQPGMPGVEATMLAQGGTEGDQPHVTAAPRGTVTAEALPPPPGIKGQAGPASGQARSQPATATDALAAGIAAPPPDLNRQQILQEPVRPTSIYIQAGAFTIFDNANRLRARLQSVAPAKVSSIMVKGIEYFRVRIGPLQSVDQADHTLQQVINLGQADARIVVD